MLLVKLADRLHNMRTLDHVKPDKRMRIAQETMDIYAPLAGRMGMQNGARRTRGHLLQGAQSRRQPDHPRAACRSCMRKAATCCARSKRRWPASWPRTASRRDVYGREKRPYSIWRKMERKHLSLGQLSDIFGFRVLVGTVDQCYRALGIVHRTWRAVPGRFKDYISTPKQNDYRSLHTTVIGPHHMRVEMQIRTRLMHEIAERGVAAHALYKDAPDAEEALDGFRPPAAESNAYRWLRHLVEMLSEGDSPKEFLEHTKLELFHDQVFCFTPKGQLIALPQGRDAHRFRLCGAHLDRRQLRRLPINGRHAPLVTELENGDEVEIIRSEAQVPPAAWEGLAVTGKARAAIRRATRSAVRKQYAGLGREIVEKLLAKHERKLRRARKWPPPCRGSGTRMSTTRWPRSGAANLSGHDVLQGHGDHGRGQPGPRGAPQGRARQEIRSAAMRRRFRCAASTATAALRHLARDRSGAGRAHRRHHHARRGHHHLSDFRQGARAVRQRAGTLGRSRLGQRRRGPALSGAHQGRRSTTRSAPSPRSPR